MKQVNDDKKRKKDFWPEHPEGRNGHEDSQVKEERPCDELR